MADFTEATAEVYASNPQDDLVLDTIEIRHPSFVDDAGNPTAVRAVANFESLDARLELNAPLNPGEMVSFQQVGFKLTLPALQQGQAPELQLTIDGASREIIAHLENAITMTDKVAVTFRRYLASNPSAGPQDKRPMTLYASVVKATLANVTMTASLTDIHNKAFPSELYLPSVFVGLNRSS